MSLYSTEVPVLSKPHLPPPQAAAQNLKESRKLFLSRSVPPTRFGYSPPCFNLPGSFNLKLYWSPSSALSSVGVLFGRVKGGTVAPPGMNPRPERWQPVKGIACSRAEWHRREGQVREARVLLGGNTHLWQTTPHLAPVTQTSGLWTNWFPSTVFWVWWTLTIYAEDGVN